VARRPGIPGDDVDYRGIGLSAPRSLRGFEIDLFDWATQDCAAVIDFVKERLPDAPLATRIAGYFPGKRFFRPQFESTLWPLVPRWIARE
jgi:hypothetical protein